MYHSIGYKQDKQYEYWGAFGAYFGLTLEEIWLHYDAPKDDPFRKMLFHASMRQCWGITLEDYPAESISLFVKSVLDSARDVRAENYAGLMCDDEQIGWMKTTFGQLVGFLVDWGLVTPELAKEYDIDALIAMQEDGEELI